MLSVVTNAAIYTRISRDPEGQELGVKRQAEDCRELAKQHGLTVVAEFQDNDISASTLSRTPRPDYDRMLAAARTRDFEVVIAYSNSRLTRRPLELEDLIKLHGEHGTRYMTVVSGDDDLSTADGRMVARIKASVDAAEAERTGERLKRSFLQRAQAGKPKRGRRPFGWQADRETLDPTEGKLLREAIDDVISGRGLNAICREWNAADVVTPAGKPWDHRSLRRMLQSPRLAGWVTYQGQMLKGPDGLPIEGPWAAAVDAATWHALQAALSPRATGRVRPGARKYLLTGVMRCGICGARMHGQANKRGRFDYSCQKYNVDNAHAVAIDGPQADEAVLAVIEASLSHEDLTAPAPSEVFDGDDRLSEIPAKVAELMAAYNTGSLSAAVVFPNVQGLEQEQDVLLAHRARWQAERGGAPRPVSAEALQELDVDRQRAAVDQLISAVVVDKAERRGAAFTKERLNVVWRA